MRENPVNVADVGDAGIRMCGRTGRIEFNAVNKACGAGAIDLIRRRCIREVQREQRLEAAARRQRRQDALPVGVGHVGRDNGRFEVWHHNGSPEALRRESDDSLESRAVAQVHVPVVRPLNAQPIHLGAFGAAGQPPRSRSRVKRTPNPVISVAM